MKKWTILIFYVINRFVDAQVRALAVKQPALLVVAPATIKAGVATFTERFGKKLAEVLEFMVDDPGAFWDLMEYGIVYSCSVGVMMYPNGSKRMATALRAVSMKPALPSVHDSLPLSWLLH